MRSGKKDERTRSIFSRNGKTKRTHGNSLPGHDTLLAKHSKPLFSKATANERSTKVLIFQQLCFRSDIKKIILTVRRGQLQNR